MLKLGFHTIAEGHRESLMISENRWSAGSLRIFCDGCGLLRIPSFLSSVILQSLIIVFLLPPQLYHRIFGSFMITGAFPLTFHDRSPSLWTVHNRWNRTHIYSGDPQRSDLSRSLRIAGQFKCCFHIIVDDCHKTSAIISDCQRSSAITWKPGLTQVRACLCNFAL